jgi:hypothetical protein
MRSNRRKRVAVQLELLMRRAERDLLSAAGGAAERQLAAPVPA